MASPPFTNSEVMHILRLSEGSEASTGRRAMGHAGAQHVTLSNRQLEQRLSDGMKRASGGGIALYTAFPNFREQVAALTEAFNSPEAVPLLEAFAALQDGKDKTFEHLPLASPKQMRYAAGGGAKTYPCNTVTIVLRKDRLRPRGMHVITAYGTMGEPLT